jgi:hypothetical protein
MEFLDTRALRGMMTLSGQQIAVFDSRGKGKN